MESVRHQIEYKRLEDIRPYDNNPRRNDEAAKAVANSIREFGFQSPSSWTRTASSLPGTPGTRPPGG